MRLTKHQLRVLGEMVKLDADFTFYGNGFQINRIKANAKTIHFLVENGLIHYVYYRELKGWGLIGGEWVILQAGKQEILKRGRK